MDTEKLDMFKIEGQYCGRTHIYDLFYDMKKDKNTLEKLIANLGNPQILCYTGLDTINFAGGDVIGYDIVQWLYEKKYRETDTENDIRECLIRCSTEDKEWTKKRNEGLTGIFYRKITFLPEIQALIKEQCQEYINALDVMIVQSEKKQAELKAAQEQRFIKWKQVKIYKSILPSGGENGTDGYIDADYQSADGTIIRMVSRDVFDFGTYSYPKRLENTKKALQSDAKTEEEKSLNSWLCEFGKFHGIRM